MQATTIPDKFQPKAINQEIHRMLSPASPSSWMIKPGNERMLGHAWKARIKRDIQATLQYLRKRKVPPELVRKAKEMLEAVNHATGTEYKAYKQGDLPAKAKFLTRSTAIMLGYDYFAQFPEPLMTEVMNPNPPPDLSHPQGILALTNAYPVRINDPEVDERLVLLPAPLILAWQGAVNGWIKSYESPARAENHSYISNAWNRLGGTLAAQSQAEQLLAKEWFTKAGHLPITPA